ncbi:hypothetical protein EDB83DRAFT_2318757 [Lactarius deliciosus]|nr:hypothetical protein EDB83DRAFT_2318757 [Lactarius deliciosus]
MTRTAASAIPHTAVANPAPLPFPLFLLPSPLPLLHHRLLHRGSGRGRTIIAWRWHSLHTANSRRYCAMVMWWSCCGCTIVPLLRHRHTVVTPSLHHQLSLFLIQVSQATSGTIPLPKSPSLPPPPPCSTQASGCRLQPVATNKSAITTTPYSVQEPPQRHPHMRWEQHGGRNDSDAGKADDDGDDAACGAHDELAAPCRLQQDGNIALRLTQGVCSFDLGVSGHLIQDLDLNDFAENQPKWCAESHQMESQGR